MGSLLPLRRRWRFIAFIVTVFLCIVFLFDFEVSDEAAPSREHVSPPKKWPVQTNGKIKIRVDQSGAVMGTTRHPMYDLLEDAEKKWKLMVESQSKTLAQAVDEYKRRYGRYPPKGFEDWFRYSQEKKVMLIDEFNQIEHDILPYLATPPKIMVERIRKLETHADSFHIEIRNKKMAPAPVGGKVSDRAVSMRKLVEDFAHLLPDLDMHASVHDTGAHIMRDDMRSEAIKVVKDHELLTRIEIAAFENKKTRPEKTVLKACGEDTSAVRESKRLRAGSANNTFEFISNHRATMNFCDNPELLRSHGTFIWDGARDSFLEPFFVSCRLAQGPELLMPALSGYEDRRGSKIHPWAGRSAVAYWRGSTTGNHYKINDWERSHRIVLHQMTNERGSDQVQVLVEDPAQANKVMKRTYARKVLNDLYMDIGLVGPAIQCEKPDGTCEVMQKTIKWKPRAHANDGLKFKYAVDVDGNGWSQRFQRLLASGAVVLKGTIFPEWNTDWLIPYYHYLPIQMDYSDLYNTMAFFAGSPEGTGAHDEIAEKISQNARRFTEENWRWEDMQSYMFRLLLEYARAASSDREAMTYKP